MTATVAGSPGTRDARLGFTGLDEEIVADLAVEGALPPWLAGSLLRTGPARWDLGAQTVAHWFDGLAMLHRFTFGDGRVSYGNRFLRGRAFAAAQRDGRVAYREFATDPCRSAFRRIASVFAPSGDLSDNGAVNVHKLGERWLALTETPMPVEFDPHTLETLGVADPPPGHHTTAHPHDDDGVLWGHGVHFGARSSYLVYTMRPGRRDVLARIPVRRPAYHHSFSLTPRAAVLAEGPFTADPLRLAVGKTSFAESFAWHPERDGRLLAVDRASGELLGEWATEPFFCFHHVNAFEDGDDLVVDLLAFDDASIVDKLSLGRLRAGEAAPMPELRRYRLQPGRRRARGEVLSTHRLELPITHYAQVNGRPYRWVWGVGSRDGWFDEVVKVDVTTGEARTWADPGTFPGEPVFAARPGGGAEDDGVLLTVVLEPEREASSLVVLDAATLDELARARVPHHVPFGFHGHFAEEVR